MAELSTTRANFYKQIYFPSTYYKEVFEVTLEEAGDLQKAQDDLQKLLIDADQNLQRLAEVYRPRGAPLQDWKVEEFQRILDEGAEGRDRLRKQRQALLKDPSASARAQIQLAAQDYEKEQDVRLAPNTSVFKGFVEAEAAKAVKDLPRPVAFKILADLAAKYPDSATNIQQVGRSITNDPNLTLDGIKEQASSSEANKAAQTWANSTGGLTPEQSRAQRELDALKSPFANASTEQTGRIAAGLQSDDEDDLLRLYLSKLQDRETPGVVTPEEFASDPDLAKGEEVYNKVKATGGYLKTSAKWFADDYLTALQTKARLEKKAKDDPFDGLDPYRWSQREALKRGGYTKESLLHLKMLTERPDVAPYVGPAFARLRAEGGLEPKSAAEATIRAAFERNQNLTLAELDAELTKKRQAITSAGRKAGRETEGGGRSWEAADLRKEARGAANDLYGGVGPAEEAKAYLLALRLNKAGTPATPDTGTKIETSVTAADVAPTPVEQAGATANKAAVKAEKAAEKSAEKAATDQKQKSDIPTDEDIIDLMGPPADASGFVADPSDPAYSYKKMPNGAYMYAFKGIPQKELQPGTRAFQSVESVLAGGEPLPPPRKNPPRVDFNKFPKAEVSSSGPAPAPAPDPAPAPAPAPAPPPKPIEEMTDEELRALIGGQ